MRPWLIVVLTLAGCEFLPCPRDVTLTAADVPCDCAGAVVESVDCGDLVCGEFGLELVKGTGTEDCVTTSTYTEYSNTPLE